MTQGSRLEVWQGKKDKTSGGLTKKDLKKNKAGRIVSKRVSDKAANRSNLKRFLIRSRSTRKRKKPVRYGS